jgi:hypothetical protein
MIKIRENEKMFKAVDARKPDKPLKKFSYIKR